MNTTVGRAWSMSLNGLDATLVEAEVFIGSGLPRVVLVGLTDTCVQEARERCRAAVTSSALEWPVAALTINLSPADVPKTGAQFDLPIVCSVLAATRSVPEDRLRSTILLGELSLDGRVRPVRGVLPALLAARERGFTHAVVPAGQLREARLVDRLSVVGVERLGDVVAWLRGERVPEPRLSPVSEAARGTRLDLADVVGQPEAKWALEVAAAGGHHVAFSGPPGVGKTLLAERLVGVLPDLSLEESQEVSAIHSLAGRSLEAGLITRPPFANPHHTASQAAIVGGGSGIATPGAVSQAHRGVLFLDEAPEFSVRVLEALRQPLESGIVVHARSKAQTTFPALFQLVLASNPCPCGWYGVRGGGRCTCAPHAIRRYADRLSGPILDRIDIQQHLRPLRGSYLRSTAVGESSAVVAERVRDARERQRHRLSAYGVTTNAAVPGSVLRYRLKIPDGADAVELAVRRGQLSARGVDKVLRLAWSIADLGGRSAPTRDDVQAALGMRRGDAGAEVRCA